MVRALAEPAPSLSQTQNVDEPTVEHPQPDQPEPQQVDDLALQLVENEVAAAKAGLSLSWPMAEF